MAVLTGAFQTATAVGQREDLSDMIYMISPVETPFMTAAERGKASGVTHEWQTDSLAAAAANAQIEGDEVTFSVPAVTVRPKNYCQISYKTAAVTGTLDAVSKAGRKKELAYQITKRAKELKRDMELTCLQRQAGVAASPRALSGIENWYVTNVSRGATGASCAQTAGSPTAGAQVTDGTQRALTEALVKTVIQSVWTAGGDASLFLMAAGQKAAFSALATLGNSTRFDKGEDKRVTGGIDYYVSDFGEHKLVPSRHTRGREIHMLTPGYFSVDYLRGFSQTPLAKTGDTEKRLLLCEWTLRVSNESAHGILADLN